MGTLTGTEVINGPAGVRAQLLDARQRGWNDDYMLAALNRAMRMLSFLKADAYTVLGNVEMVPGTDQQLPEGGIALLDITGNSYSGLRVTQVDMDILNETNRFWQVTNMQRDVAHFAADSRDPTRFNVTPPNDGTGEVVALYGAVPTKLGSLADTIVFVDTYEQVLVLLTMAEAYRRSTDRQDLVKTQALVNEVRLSLGLKAQSQVAVAPKG
jgi:hypothetical protein